MVDCQAHLLSLSTGVSPNQVVSRLKKECEILVAGVPYRWIHKPHQQDADRLLAHEWSLFMLTDAIPGLLEQDADIIDHFQIDVSITEEQHKSLSFAQAIEPRPMPSTPPLPKEWTNSSTGELEIPNRHDLGPMTSPLAPGELRLDDGMTTFLSSTLPSRVASKPVSLLNLFQYPSGDSSVHDQYMEDFKRNFGDSAGAKVKFMGPVRHGPAGRSANDEAGTHRRWHDVNLVQYDTIFHYAYMLSTEIYKRLNQDKVRGLEDTCILLISEAEIAPED